jgi:hypothetical protein
VFSRCDCGSSLEGGLCAASEDGAAAAASLEQGFSGLFTHWLSFDRRESVKAQGRVNAARQQQTHWDGLDRLEEG